MVFHILNSSSTQHVLCSYVAIHASLIYVPVQLPLDASAMPLSSLGLSNGDTLVLREVAQAAPAAPAVQSTTPLTANGSSTTVPSALPSAAPEQVQLTALIGYDETCFTI